MNKRRQGFTIVELLIVIVIIAILAAISVGAYQGIQQRARNSQRLQDITTIGKALELYYIDNGRFPDGACGASCPTPKKINSSWATTSDGSWSILENALVPKYISSLPKDPSASTDKNPGIGGETNYDYYAGQGWCSIVPATAGQLYTLVYKLEGQSQKRDLTGTCTGTQPVDYPASEYIVRK